MEKIQFHIEGDNDLRQGFRMLFSQKLKKPFNINMSGDRGNAIKQYKKDHASTKYLIIDLETHPSHRTSELTKLSLGNGEKNTCFMIQKMEAWFISQADRLFDAEVVSKLPKGDPEHIDRPDHKLKEALVRHRGKGYDKRADAIKCLQNLDITELGKKFTDVENLLTNFAN